MPQHSLFAIASTAIFLSFFPAWAQAAIKIGEIPSTIELKGEAGGRVDGQGWSSSMIKGKVWTVFYVDPDEKGANEELEATLKAAEFPRDQYGSIAVINMDASWLPNAAIAASLADKQEKYPEVVYVKDLNKTLVKNWRLKDDAYVVLVFSKDGKLVYSKDGKFNKADTAALVETIKKQIASPAS